MGTRHSVFQKLVVKIGARAIGQPFKGPGSLLLPSNTGSGLLRVVGINVHLEPSHNCKLCGAYFSRWVDKGTKSNCRVTLLILDLEAPVAVPSAIARSLCDWDFKYGISELGSLELRVHRKPGAGNYKNKPKVVSDSTGTVDDAEAWDLDM